MTGGTVDFFPDWLARDDVVTRRADGPGALRNVVRSVVKNGADWVKFIATGTMGPTALEQEFDDEEVAALVGEAHRLGRRACAHA
jgi:imidazolonepropionase-like amidohydrolase